MNYIMAKVLTMTMGNLTSSGDSRNATDVNSTNTIGTVVAISIHCDVRCVLVVPIQMLFDSNGKVTIQYQNNCCY